MNELKSLIERTQILLSEELAKAERIEKSRREVEAAREMLFEQLSKTTTNISKQQQHIILDIGGTFFETTLQTISSDKNCLLYKQYLSLVSSSSSSSSSSNCIVIFNDRNPKHFNSTILSCLRTGINSVHLEGVPKRELLEMREEAVYYRLSTLVSHIDTTLSSFSSQRQSQQALLPPSVTNTLDTVASLITRGAIKLPLSASTSTSNSMVIWKCLDNYNSISPTTTSVKIEGNTVFPTLSSSNLTKLVFSPFNTFQSGNHELFVDCNFKGLDPTSTKNQEQTTSSSDISHVIVGSVGLISSDFIGSISNFTTPTTIEEREIQQGTNQKHIGEVDGQWGICEDGRFLHAGAVFETGQPAWKSGSVTRIGIRIDMDLGMIVFTNCGVPWSATISRGSHSLSLAVIASPYCSYTFIQ